MTEVLKVNDLTIYKSHWNKDEIIIKFREIGGVALDRNQAHLLKLWLEEHLK